MTRQHSPSARSLSALAVVILLLSTAGTSGKATADQAAVQEPALRPVVQSEVAHDLSPPLLSIPVPQQSEFTGEPRGNPRRIIPKTVTAAALAAADDPDAALDRGPQTPRIPSPLTSFEGINNVDGVLPPDTVGDIGPNHYIQMVNLSMAIYNRSGTALYGPTDTNVIWTGFGGACETTNNGDPIALYDHLADRWLISQFAWNSTAGPYFECIAISQTADPTGSWYRYAFQTHATKMDDYPKIGVWPDGYYMATNQFNGGSSWGGAGVHAFERSRMLQGLSAQMIYFDLYSANANFASLLPSDLDGTAPADGTPNYFVSVDDTTWGFATDRLQIWEFRVDWTTPANSTFGGSSQPTQVLDTAAFDPTIASIPQPDTTVRLDSLSDRLMYRLQYRNMGSYAAMVTNHTVDAGSDRAGVRWYEMRRSGGTWSIQQQGTYAPDDGLHRWMGSIAMNGAGDIGLGFSVSSSSVYPSIRYAGRFAADAAGTLAQGEAALIAGSGSQTHSAARWGDYSMMSVDPADDLSFWYTTEYLSTTGSAPWRTRIGKFKLEAQPNMTINDVSTAEGNSGTRLLTFTASLSAASSTAVTATFATADNTANGTLSTTVTNSTAITIGSVNATTGSPYPSTISVPALSGTVTRVTATVNLTHTWPDDLDLLLVGPAGQTCILMSDSGGSLDLSSVALVFDDSSDSSLSDAGQLSAGTFRPTNIGSSDTWPSPAPAGAYGSTLSVFNSVNPNGDWKLFVYDDEGQDGGSVNSWALTVTTNAGTDFTATSGTVSFAAGQTSRPIDVTINGDTTEESNETFYVNLSSPSGAVITDSQGLGTIQNDDLTFTDNPLSAGMVIKVVHITELRSAINTGRARHGLGSYGFSDSTVTVQSTLVRGVHIAEMRTALAEAYAAAKTTAPTYTDPALTAGSTLIKVVHINELRTAVANLP